MLKTAKYWRAFTAATRGAAERAADSWWAEQTGFDKISGWTLPASDAGPGGETQWTATIIYRPASEQPPRRLH
jgi:hypothetical protein